MGEDLLFDDILEAAGATLFFIGAGGHDSFSGILNLLPLGVAQPPLLTLLSLQENSIDEDESLISSCCCCCWGSAAVVWRNIE